MRTGHSLDCLESVRGAGLVELLGETAKARAKRRPAPKLMQHLKRINALPKPHQRVVMDVIEAMLAQQVR